MRKFLLILGVSFASLYNAQNVGINTSQPTATLDVDGNGRYRQLPNANGLNGYSSTVVSKEDGTLGHKLDSKVLLNIEDYSATNLRWNMTGTATNETAHLLFGNKSDIAGVQPGNHTNTATTFTATEEDVININALVSFKLAEFPGADLATLSTNGERQVIIYLYLYKGDTMLRKTKRVISFRGRQYLPPPTTNDNDREIWKYDPLYSEPIEMTYHIPLGQSGRDYSVSVVIASRAPEGGNFRLTFDQPNTLRQSLTVSK